MKFGTERKKVRRLSFKIESRTLSNSNIGSEIIDIIVSLKCGFSLVRACIFNSMKEVELRLSYGHVSRLFSGF